MSEYDTKPAARYGTTARARAEVDAGLRAYMLRVYNYMALGLAITGLAALGAYMLSVTDTLASAAYVLRGNQLLTASVGMALQSRDILLTTFGYSVFFSPLKWVIVFAPLALVFFLSFRVDRMSPTAAQTAFWIFSAMVGLSLGIIFLVFTHTSIVRVFFITAASFGALSLWGYTTQRDISGWGSFLFMGLIGIIIASLVNIFLVSSMLQWVISVVGVLVFAGLTAYDTQRIKEMYFAGDDDVVAGRKAIMGALALYLDFINLFTMLLQLFGQRNE